MHCCASLKPEIRKDWWRLFQLLMKSITHGRILRRSDEHKLRPLEAILQCCEDAQHFEPSGALHLQNVAETEGFVCWAAHGDDVEPSVRAFSAGLLELEFRVAMRACGVEEVNRPFDSSTPRTPSAQRGSCPLHSEGGFMLAHRKLSPPL